jgi:osmoprotectant transport system ATP-binding protein
MIELQQITHRYRPDGPDVIDDLTLHVAAGEFVALVGESGCGKTTTLKTINRLVRPSQGAVTVDGRDVSKVRATKLRRGIGYVFQQIGLLPHLTVADNIAVVPRLLRWKPAAVEARVQELLGLVNLPAEAASQMPDQLSGGQQQRVGVARALAARPRVMLMDEPFGALDPINRAALQHEVARLHRELELTTVLVTHDMAEALLLADRVAVMREGRLLQVGTPRDLLTHPADDYVASVVGTPRRQADRIEALAGDVANRGELLGIEPLYEEGDQP